LVIENALLRHQLVVLRRTAARPTFTPLDRGLLVLLASWLRTWADALLIAKPETVLRWHRQGFRLFWRRKSTAASRKPRLAEATIDLIKRMAAENRWWGAERIRGEVLKLNIRVSKRTIQKYLRQVRAPRPSGQTWATFLRCHFTNQPSGEMDVRLAGVLVKAAQKFAAKRIDIVSGFRAPKYNLILRKKGREVARDSQHTRGHAVDFRIPGVRTAELMLFVKSLRLGGVGFYPESAFVHADTGPVRQWTAR
jgi:uncharacterized protein YcbK (DUF882 family)